MTFPADVAGLPRPIPIDPDSTTSNPGPAFKGPMFSVDYNVEGADVGYKWFLRQRIVPLFPFGYGLSYTRFSVRRFRAAERDGTIVAAFDVTNSGARAGVATPQVYLDGPDFTRRLVGFDSVALRPGETCHVSVAVDPRLAARFDVAAHGWSITTGRYTVAVRLGRDGLWAGSWRDARTSRVVGAASGAPRDRVDGGSLAIGRFGLRRLRCGKVASHRSRRGSMSRSIEFADYDEDFFTWTQ